MSQINNSSAATAIQTTAPKPKAAVEKKEAEAVTEKKKPVSKEITNKDISEA